jgi:hypothetical protein
MCSNGRKKKNADTAWHQTTVCIGFLYVGFPASYAFISFLKVLTYSFAASVL